MDCRRNRSFTHETVEQAVATARKTSGGLQGAVGLGVVSGQDRVTGGEPCHFVGAAIYDKRGGNDPSGTLYLTKTRAIFLAADDGLTTAAWSKVIAVTRADKTLRVQRNDRQTPYSFVCPQLADAMKAEFVAHVLHGIASKVAT